MKPFVRSNLTNKSFRLDPTMPASVCTTDAAAAASLQDKNLKHKRRFCKAPNCERIVKSQGLCQRHGAKPRKCKLDICSKQAQGNYDGMCKSHFKAHKRDTTPLPPKPELPPPPQGASVYDEIIPASLLHKAGAPGKMPLVEHLGTGFAQGRPPAWHRNEERLARGHWPVDNAATQLEGWERELVWTEILLLTGNEEASFRHLARAWGRDKGFQRVLSQFICERRGNVERKKRERPAVVRNPDDSEVEDDDDDPQADASDDLMDLFDYYGDAAYNEALAADLMPVDSHGNLCDPTLVAYQGQDSMTSSSSSGEDSEDEHAAAASTAAAV